MTTRTAVALGLAAASTTLTNVAYSREQQAAAALPVLSLRQPVRSMMLLLTSRRWLTGFALETGGFLLYAAALALSSLAVVQSIGAGGIGVLAFVSARVSGRRLGSRRRAGVLLSIVGLFALGVSLMKSSGQGTNGSTAAVILWLSATALLALGVLALGRRTGAQAVAHGLAGGLLFSIGDISTKLATQGNARVAFVVTLVIGYALGTSLLQVGYQHGSALTVAGLSNLMTNALPIAAGTTVLQEPVPTGLLGVLRVFAFGAVTVSAILLARPEPSRPPHPSEPAGVPAG